MGLFRRHKKKKAASHGSNAPSAPTGLGAASRGLGLLGSAGLGSVLQSPTPVLDQIRGSRGANAPSEITSMGASEDAWLDLADDARSEVESEDASDSIPSSASGDGLGGYTVISEYDSSSESSDPLGGYTVIREHDSSSESSDPLGGYTVVSEVDLISESSSDSDDREPHLSSGDGTFGYTMEALDEMSVADSASEEELDDPPDWARSDDRSPSGWGGWNDATGTYRDLASLGAQYVGEHSVATWRYGFDYAERGNKIVTTKHDDAQRDQDRITVGEDGRLLQGGQQLDTQHARGGRLDSEQGAFIFAMSATGDLQGADQIGRNQGFVDEQTTAWNWARDTEGVEAGDQDAIAAQFGTDVLAKRYLHHSSFFGGQDVAGAGELAVHDGRVKHLTPNSGHYTPDLFQTTNVVHALDRQGADLGSALVDVARRDENGEVVKDGNSFERETFHAGEILASEGDYTTLMNRKAMLAELHSLTTGPKQSQFDTEELLDGMLDHESPEAMHAEAMRNGWEWTGLTGQFVDLEALEETDSPTELARRARTRAGFTVHGSGTAEDEAPLGYTALPELGNGAVLGYNAIPGLDRDTWWD